LQQQQPVLLSVTARSATAIDLRGIANVSLRASESIVSNTASATPQFSAGIVGAHDSKIGH
jgi:hypothetical protein